MNSHFITSSSVFHQIIHWDFFLGRAAVGRLHGQTVRFFGLALNFGMELFFWRECTFNIFLIPPKVPVFSKYFSPVCGLDSYDDDLPQDSISWEATFLKSSLASWRFFGFLYAYLSLLIPDHGCHSWSPSIRIVHRSFSISNLWSISSLTKNVNQA